MAELQYGLRDGKLVNILDLDETERGLTCNCVCPGCGMELQAKIGTGQRERHFSHNNAKCDITTANQTALHILAKEIIEETKTILFPPVKISFEEVGFSKEEIGILRHLNNISEIPAEIEILPAKSVEFDCVELEKKVSTIVPDIVTHIGNKVCLIEIAVRHFVDKKKLQKIQELNLPVLEIDLSSISNQNINKAALKDIIVKQLENKKWIHNPKKEEKGVESVKAKYQKYISDRHKYIENLPKTKSAKRQH